MRRIGGRVWPIWREGVCRDASVRRETTMSDEGALFDRLRDAVTGDSRDEDEGRRYRDDDQERGRYRDEDED
jgi:hypothetical protein